MAAADDDGSSKKSTFWWLEAVRYVVAGVVVVLIAAVVINAIKVIFRPDSLHMVVVGGSIPARNLSSSDDDTYKSVALDLNLRCQNPSGRARMYYTGITFYLLNSTTSPFSPTLDKDAILYSDMPDIAVAQQDTANSVSTTTVENVTSVYASQFNILYRGGSFGNMTMKLNGNLITEVTINGTRMTTYLCGPLLIGGGSDDGMYLQDVPCKEMQNGHFIQ